MKSISINSVLANLSMLIDERYWNEATMLEHAAKGFLQMNLINKFEDKVTTIEIVEHKGTIPEDLRFITSVVAKKDTVFFTVKAATNPYMKSICENSALVECPDCKYEFTVSANGVITTNLHTGELIIAYKGIPTDEEGNILIPDDETLKEALTHFVLYKYWLTKDLMKEEGAAQRMSNHLTMWSTLSKKAMNLNLPNVSELENLKNINNRLVPRTNAHSQLFSRLNNQENIDF